MEEFEIKHDITVRWNPFEDNYNKKRNQYCVRKLDSLIDKFRKYRNDYISKKNYLYNHNHKGRYKLLLIGLLNLLVIFLLILLYLGNKISQKYQQALTNIIKVINKLIDEYNQIFSLLPNNNKHDFPVANFKSIITLSSDFWKMVDVNLDLEKISPRIIMYEAITNYNNLNRAREESSLIIQEFKRLVTHWQNMEDQLKHILDDHVNHYDGSKIKVNI